ncbi:unnamed protein product [Protopolystoma xenopodis]|uniref:Uncharacterized protein n=1 Tax=Protopolystoma xenopodis TaxID=117903 RepID=A0A448XEG5_9PLAT|nr:unnamed protein product [Protopolystoma xenopodis]
MLVRTYTIFNLYLHTCYLSHIQALATERSALIANVTCLQPGPHQLQAELNLSPNDSINLTESHWLNISRHSSQDQKQQPVFNEDTSSDVIPIIHADSGTPLSTDLLVQNDVCNRRDPGNEIDLFRSKT